MLTAEEFQLAERERWWALPSHPMVEVSTRGEVRTWFRRGKVLDEPVRVPASINPSTGYRQIQITYHGNPLTVAVHRLVMRVHGGPKPPDCEVRHLNGDRLDNRLGNLAWGTHQENVDDMRRHGTTPRGERNGQAKLTEPEVLAARSRRRAGWKVDDIAREFGVSQSAMSNAINGITWTHVPGAVALRRT